MRYNRLGDSGLLVSELCLGTMTFGGGEGRWRLIGAVTQDEADALVRQALDAGINFIDTADLYAEGLSERILGQSLKTLGVARDEVVVATKVLGAMGAGANSAGLSRSHILAAAQASLKRLQLDHIDLYQVHGFDTVTPIEETLEALDQLVRQGAVRYVGLSNWAAWQVVKALGIGRGRGLAPVVSLQAYYTLVGRDIEREILPMLRSERLGLLVWSPLAGGYLSGKYAGKAETDARRTNFSFPPVYAARGEPVLAALQAVADAHGATPAQVALAWLLHRPEVTSVILGAKRPDQLAENILAAELALGADDMARLDDASRLVPEYPAWMQAVQANYRTVKPAAPRLQPFTG